MSARSSYGNNPDFIRAKSMRRKFETLKLTPAYERWRREQFNVQRGLCAWCRQSMPRSLAGIHTDHALALFHGGSNDYSNLVLSHAACNLAKWIRIDGVPQWITNNRMKLEKNRARRQLHRHQARVRDELLQEHHDEQIAAWLRSWV